MYHFIINHRSYQTATLANASRIHQILRLRLNGNDYPDTEVFDDDKKLIARITYNGRVWPPEPWYDGQKPLEEAAAIPQDFDYLQVHTVDEKGKYVTDTEFRKWATHLVKKYVKR